MKILETAGIDVSKKVIDVYLYKKGIYCQFENDLKGFKEMGNWLKRNLIAIDELLVALEHTGLYSYNLSNYLAEQDFNYVVLPALEIKRSTGIARGKADKVDAKRIALYAYEKRERIALGKRSPKNIIKLKRLLSLRERIVKQRAGYKASIKEQLEMLPKKEAEVLVKCQMKIIKSFDKEVDYLENEIEKIIESDEKIKTQYKLITTIKGVGAQTALYMIVVTEGFEKFDNWRKFASYCGTAPFPNTSGSSIRGRTKVSSLANKKIKSLLDLCAKSSIQFNEEMKRYYTERVSRQKNKMSTINIIRNKILARIFAVVKRETPYVDLMKYAA
ncbi:IS110 family transposase [Flavobacterium sp. MFBS3-15]|uniref:IS110 family transposase n=1 Tax=Flavobacterium sp. MFBS3-15 TaxID=2989816 RepID=UPI002236868B|nr:IS110 family transposase [Flavobacterium sp. MFBS3-15]MCW4470900.1 IS110 family transposase [Flavobacterium sp. MFBS3-15]